MAIFIFGLVDIKTVFRMHAVDYLRAGRPHIFASRSLDCLLICSSCSNFYTALNAFSISPNTRHTHTPLPPWIFIVFPAIGE